MSRQYISAGKIVTAVLEEGKSLKRYCGNQKTNIGKTDFALACETLKYHKIIQNFLQLADISIQSLDLGCPAVIFVMLYELLFGKGKIEGGGSVKRKALEIVEPLKILLSKEMKERNLTNYHDLLSDLVRLHSSMNKFVRINVLKANPSEIISELTETIQSNFLIDNLIPNLLSFPSNSSSLAHHPMVQEGRLIIQDKASCFPSQILMDEWKERFSLSVGGDIIDACAAPGNKTSHMAALLHEFQVQNSPAYEGGRRKEAVLAFDRNPRRAALLSSRLRLSGALSGDHPLVTVHNEDFLSLDVSLPRFSEVRALLLDPSCSGSGVVRSLERAIEVPGDSPEPRLNELASFQKEIILKAMTFPRAEIIVYSTCSIHPEENEEVVAHILTSPEALEGGWSLKEPARWRNLPWPLNRRGHTLESSPTQPNSLNKAEAQKLIRCSPEDGLNGFFVTLFSRETPQLVSIPASSTSKSSKDESNPTHPQTKRTHDSRVEHPPKKSKQTPKNSLPKFRVLGLKKRKKSLKRK